MRVLTLIFSGLLLAGADDPDRPRIVSTSLCGDAYVLSMVAHKDIAALSWQAGDTLSTAPKNLKTKPKAWDDGERLLALGPTLVLFGPGEGAAAKPLLDKAGVRHITLDWGESFPALNRNRAKLSKALGKKHFNPFILIDINVSRPKILYLSASGGTAGPGTYVNAAIWRAGGKNIVTTSGWHTPDVETLIRLEPDLIVTSFFKDGYASVNSTGLNNKLLQDKIKATPHINVPGKLWPCAGPGLYEASDIIAKAIKGLE
ncbi:MAG: hypothetical protein JKY25_04595 [Robiginitomaculum sp.]|nr:hypothetical protein [Robiginitomaculum sp.]